jgi:NH3-dependent NAD+ synthetase
VLGLSGGIDSAVVACLAAEALGPENVWGVTMPTQYSSHGSVEDSRQLAAALGIRFLEIPIKGAFEAVRASSTRFSPGCRKTRPRKTCSPVCAA